MLVKLLQWIGGVVVGLVVVGFLLDETEEKSSAAEPGNVVAVEEQAPPLEVTADELLNAYSENEIAANQKYKDRRLLLNARISSIEAGIGDVPYVVLTAGSEFEFNRPQARLAKSEVSAAAALKKGQKISLLCIGNGEIAGTPMLAECSVKQPS